MEAAPPLRLVDTTTGEVVERKHSFEELEILCERYKAKFDGALMENGKLRKEVAGVRELEPDAKVITDILGFWLDWSGRSRCTIDSSTERWKNTAIRLKQKPNARGEKFTAARLKAAIVGSPRHGYLGKDPLRQDPAVIFKKSEWVEECERLAGEPSRQRPVKVVNMTPLEVALATLRREYGSDTVEALWDLDTHSLGEAWAPCPLHPGHPPKRNLRLQESCYGGAVKVACAGGCERGDVMEALRALYGLQASREFVEEIADLRTRVMELEAGLRVYAHEWNDRAELLARDGGYVARQALGWEAA